MIGIVTDSSSQLPAELADRYGIEIAPIRVTVDDREYREGVDLDADGFWELWAAAARDGRTPVVSTSAPTPGDIADAYRRAAARGATEILSVHVGSIWSGTCNAAVLAAAMVDVPVQLVDTDSLSFGVSCCVWDAAEAVRSGATLDQAAEVAAAVSRRMGSTTVVGALEVARAGGRLAGQLADGTALGDAIPVFCIVGDTTEVIGHGRTIDELADSLVAPMVGAEGPCRVAICIADASAEPLRDAMEARLVGQPTVVDLVRYRVGPSIGAHTGPGTAGGFWYPLDR